MIQKCFILDNPNFVLLTNKAAGETLELHSGPVYTT